MSLKTCHSNLKAFQLVDGEIKQAPVEVLKYVVNDTQIKIQFHKGHIFGVQFIKANQVGELLVFGHKEIEYRICIVDKDTPGNEIKKILL